MTAAICLAAALALLMVPGVAVSLVAGTSWRDAVAAGPALTLAVVAVGSSVTAAADGPWEPATALATVLVAVLCAGSLGLAARVVAGSARRRGPPGPKAGRPDVGKPTTTTPPTTPPTTSPPSTAGRSNRGTTPR